MKPGSGGRDRSELRAARGIDARGYHHPGIVQGVIEFLPASLLDDLDGKTVGRGWGDPGAQP